MFGFFRSAAPKAKPVFRTCLNVESLDGRLLPSANMPNAAPEVVDLGVERIGSGVILITGRVEDDDSTDGIYVTIVSDLPGLDGVQVTADEDGNFSYIYILPEDYPYNAGLGATAIDWDGAESPMCLLPITLDPPE